MDPSWPSCAWALGEDLSGPQTHRHQSPRLSSDTQLLDTLLREQCTGTYPVKRGACLRGLAGPFSDGHTQGRRSGEGGLQALSKVTTPLWLLSRT